MKKLAAIIMFLSLSVSAYASVRSIYQTKDNLFLHEKIASHENLLDNPAQLNNINYYLVENNSTINLRTTQPYDAVYVKENKNDAIRTTLHAIIPVGDRLRIHSGYNYVQSINSIKTSSSLDGFTISSMDKSFVRNVIATIATNYIDELEIGYSFQIENHNHFIDLVSRDTSNTLSNNLNSMKHIFGIVYNDIEFYASLNRQYYLADHHYNKEIDFVIDGWEINVRKLFGEIDEQNVLLEIGLLDAVLKQSIFEFGRDEYDLDFPDYKIKGSIYGCQPLDRIELSIGIEFEYISTHLFNVNKYIWIDKKDTVLQLPAQIKVTLFPWCDIWLETKMKYQASSYNNKQIVKFQNSFGIHANLSIIEIRLYTLPAWTLESFDNNDSIHSFHTGMSLTVRY